MQSVIDHIRHNYVLWTTAMLFGLLGTALLIEYARRWKDRRRQLRTEWAAVREITEEKGLSKESWELLETLVRRYAPNTPLRTITLRQYFNQCVERHIEAVKGKKDFPLLQRQGELLRDLRVHLGLDYIPIGQRIDSTRELYHGQHIWVAPKEKQSAEWVRMVTSAVNEAFFQLVPHEPANPIPFNTGDQLQCRMWREEDARYGFDVMLVQMLDNPPTWVFEHTNVMHRMQARAHFRIRVDQSTEVGIINAPVDGDMSDVAERPVVTRLRGRITSLSGGGFAVVVTQPVPKQVLLRVLLDLGEDKSPVEVTGQMVGSSTLSAGRYLLRTAFVGITDELRETITHFIFQQQQPIRQAESESVLHME
ncbi:MAG TPA: PilZ domain-containing protein [Candidatus Hydrogenedentes bacterium]|nr:PilZ domain-containing protein [Candidatus Hydrogenedentota bacterium]